MMFNNLAKTISNKNRQRKYNFFLNQLAPKEDTTILDVGYGGNDWHGVENFLEKNYPYQKNITALGIDEGKEFSKQYPLINVVVYDGNIFPFANKQFDIVWSNAVIEHVGNYEKQKLYLSELVRTGRKLFMTTPNKYFPIEVHTRTPLLHFLPKRIFDKFLVLVNKKWATGNYMHLLSKRDLVRLLNDVGVKDYKIKRNRFFLFTLDFVVLIK